MTREHQNTDENRGENRKIALVMWTDQPLTEAEIEFLASGIVDKTGGTGGADCGPVPRSENRWTDTGKVFVPSMHCKGCRGSNRLPQSDFQTLTRDKYYDADFELMLLSALFGFLLLLASAPMLARLILEKGGK